MRTILMICVSFLWLSVLCGQSLFRPLFVPYSGANIESYRLLYGSQLPYDGIGKRVILEQIPETWYRKMGRSVQPSGGFFDAFGMILPTNEPIYWLSRSAIMSDRFGNVGLEVKNSYNFWKLQLRSAAFIQHRRPTFSRFADKQDYYASNKFNWHMHTSASEHWYNWNTTVSYGGSAFVLYSDEWAGRPGYREHRDSVWGFGTKALQVNASAFGKCEFRTNDPYAKWRHQVGGLLDYKRHQQEQLLSGSETYAGKEDIRTVALHYQMEGRLHKTETFLNISVAAGRDSTTERVDTFVRPTVDRFFSLMMFGNLHYTEWAHVKGGANIEKHTGQRWQFLPKLELDFVLPKSWSLSLFGATGMRQLKPISFFSNWLALAEGVRFEADPYEFSRRAGLSIGRQKKQTVSLSLDMTQFDNKLIVRKDTDNRLFFSTFERPLRRFTADLNVHTPLGKDLRWALYGQYRYEHFSADNPMTYQNAHQIQAQIQYAYKIFGTRLTYAVRLPEHFSTPFQRLDYVATVTPWQQQGRRFWRSLSFSLHLDNAQQWLLPRPTTITDLPPILLEEDLNLWQMPNIRFVAHVPLH